MTTATNIKEQKMSNNKFQIGESVLLNGKTYEIIGTIKRSFLLERDGKQYKATAKMMGKIQDQNKMGIGVGRKKRQAKDYLAEKLAWKKIFDKDAKLPETEDEYMNWFASLSGELSPENLSCDGELNRTQINAKLRKIRGEWKQLEKRFGRKVTEDEAESHMMKKYWEKRKNS
jgi:hypothetical protein